MGTRYVCLLRVEFCFMKVSSYSMFSVLSPIFSRKFTKVSSLVKKSRLRVRDVV